MARIRQIGAGQHTSGTIDGITYVTRGKTTYARVAGVLPERVYRNPNAQKFQAIFKLIHNHIKYHYATIKQTIMAESNTSARNQYISINYHPLANALDSLAVRMVDGEYVSIAEIEEAITTYATANPGKICIANKPDYKEVYLTGAWPATITLQPIRKSGSVMMITSQNSDQ